MSFYVSEYLTRLTLAKLGQVYGEIDCFESQIFCIIAGELSKIEREEVEKARKKRGR